MSRRRISEMALLQPPVLRTAEPVAAAVRTILDSGLPALAVADERERYAGIFGEREFLAALFPGYLRELRGAAFLSRSLDPALRTRDACAAEPVGRHMNTEHIEVGPEFSDVQVAEIFLHHRVLVVPVVADGRVEGLLTRSDFFRALAEPLAGDG
jgi:CBS domain-containing protein